MPYLRLSLLEPRPGMASELHNLLEELDENLAQEQGLILSFVFGASNAPRMGRMAIWQSKDDANQGASADRVLALRSRITWASTRVEESLLEVRAEDISSIRPVF